MTLFKNKFILLLCYLHVTSMLLASSLETTTVSKEGTDNRPLNNIKTIYFAAGCFWGVEKHFENMSGVIKAESGYVGGNYANPNYDTVLKYRNLKDTSKILNYAEGVKVTFDNEKVDAKTLIKSFWELHDPTQVDGQGNDKGNNYRSAIFYTNKYQNRVAYETQNSYQDLLYQNGYGEIVTEIKPFKKFYMAEKYHQDYLQKNPAGYCPNHSTGVKFTKLDKKQKYIEPLGAKEIIVIDSQNYCPYCERFKADVTDNYKGSIPLRTTHANLLKGFFINTQLNATPTIIFLEDGKELFAVRGYMNAKEFYKKIGAFKLGKDSQSYKVAFSEGTDGRFCKQYDIFKHTPDGIFIDKLSGEVLFDTRDRFNSGTGWLSFYKSVEGSTIERQDNSYGMKRVEIIAKKSGIHLGHVFPRADGRKRFCINATVLEFIPRDEIK